MAGPARPLRLLVAAWAALVAASACVGLLAGRARGASDDAAFVAPRLRPCAGAARDAAARRASDDGAEGVWKEAYSLEVERNSLLRDQLRSLEVEAPELLEAEPEECVVDWEGSYSRLRGCNEALEARLRGGVPTREGMRRKEAAEQDDAGVPVRLKVQLLDRETSIEVFRRHGSGSQFFTFQARLPLGLNITLREKGALRGSFVVENVLPGGSGAASGMIQPGDVVHALTTIVTTMGVTTFDSGVTSQRQHLVDTSFLGSVQQLVEALGTNTAAGPDSEVVLVFERAKPKS